MAQQQRMVADVGGTNSRIALYDPAANQFRSLGTYVNRDFSRFGDVIARWLDELGDGRPAEGCIAVAAPPDGDRVEMVNMSWAFSGAELAEEHGFSRIKLINDFEGNAYSLPHLQQQDREVLQAGVPNGPGILATMGPGTGLGGATVQVRGPEVLARACEPGHMGLSPEGELELELFRLLLPRYGNIYAELLVSGPGLQRLYEAMGEIHGQAVDARSPAEVSRRALAGGDEMCSRALQTFCGLLGSVCGDFVLANGAYSGLFLAGGIVPRMIPFLRESSFIDRFLHKGAMGEHLQRVPVYAITTAQPGLIGAAHAPL